MKLSRAEQCREKSRAEQSLWHYRTDRIIDAKGLSGGEHCRRGRPCIGAYLVLYLVQKHR